jgi:hypothetical protein
MEERTKAGKTAGLMERWDLIALLAEAGEIALIED